MRRTCRSASRRLLSFQTEQSKTALGREFAFPKPRSCRSRLIGAEGRLTDRLQPDAGGWTNGRFGRPTAGGLDGSSSAIADVRLKKNSVSIALDTSLSESLDDAIALRNGKTS